MVISRKLNQSKIFSAKQIDQEESISREESIIVEEPLQIQINGKNHSVTMRTPGDDFDLLLGLLFSERLIQSADDIEDYEELYKKDQIVPFALSLRIKKLKEPINSRSMIVNSSCGICGLESLEKYFEELVTFNYFSTPNDEILLSLPTKMKNSQKLFDETGGCHAASIFDYSGNLLVCSEDISRHNAVDKSIGYLLKNQMIKNGAYLVISGRLAFEILSKAYLAGIPNILAVSSPSSLSIEISKKVGIHIFGFCRNGKYTQYC